MIKRESFVRMECHRTVNRIGLELEGDMQLQIFKPLARSPYLIAVENRKDSC